MGLGSETLSARQTLEAVLQLTGAGLWEWDLDSGCMAGDERLRKILALPDDEWHALTDALWAARVHEEDRPAFEREMEQARQSGRFELIYRFRGGDRRWRWLQDRSGVAVRNEAGRPSQLLGVVEEVTDREEEKHRWRHLARSVPGIIYTFAIDADGTPSFPFTTDRVREFYGVTPEAVRRDASLIFDAIHPDDLPGVLDSIEQSRQTLDEWRFEYRAKAAGRWQWVEGRASPERRPDGGTVWHGLIYLIEERKRLEERLRQLSVTDELTGLYNRRRLLACMEQQIAHFRRFGTPFTVVMVDLDYFKQVNDHYGHAAGDAVLRGLADLFRQRLRETDIAGRTGGEEFLLLLPGTDVNGAVTIAETMAQALADQAFTSDDGLRFHVTLSAGVASLHEPQETLQQLWARADRALYSAKAGGRGQVCRA